jgi:galactose mutarotase-like enzyme
MPTKFTTLTDVAEGVWQDTFELRESAAIRLAAGSEWSIRKRTLRGGVSDGVDVVDLNNGALAVSILPTRGMSLWRGHYRGLDLGWDSPVKRPVNPCYVNQTDRNGLGWLTGFNELLCRCGLSSNGAPGMDVIVDNTGHRTEARLTLHGKIANLPAHHVEISVSTKEGGLMSVTGIVDEAMMFGPGLRLTTTYETVPNSNRLTMRDEVVNIAARPMELELLYHTNFGKPFLEKGSRLVLPFREAAPRDSRAAEDTKTWQIYLGPTSGYTEQCYFADLFGDDKDKTIVLLRNSAGDRGVSLEYCVRELPCFTVWKCTQPEADGYVTGLEPATNLPNLKTFERKQGRVITLAPGASHSTQIELAVHASKAEVGAVEERIGELQNRTHPIVHEQPISKYSPA